MALGPPGNPRPPIQPNPLLPGVSPRPPGMLPPGAPIRPGAPLAGPPTPGVPGAGTGPVPPPVAGAVPPGAGGLASPGNLQAALKAAGIELPPDPALEDRDLGRRSPRGSADQMYEIVAQDLAEWLNRMPKILANALKGGPHKQAPFKYPATGKQKYDIFKAKLFNEDGTANMQGRQELLQRMTPRQYAEVVHVVTRQMRRESGEME